MWWNTMAKSSLLGKGLFGVHILRYVAHHWEKSRQKLKPGGKQEAGAEQGSSNNEGVLLPGLFNQPRSWIFMQNVKIELISNFILWVLCLQACLNLWRSEKGTRLPETRVPQSSLPPCKRWGWNRPSYLDCCANSAVLMHLNFTVPIITTTTASQLKNLELATWILLIIKIITFFGDLNFLGHKYIPLWVMNCQCLKIFVTVEIGFSCSFWSISNMQRGYCCQGQSAEWKILLEFALCQRKRKYMQAVGKHVLAVSFWFLITSACILEPNCKGSSEDYNEGRNWLFII